MSKLFNLVDDRLDGLSKLITEDMERDGDSGLIGDSEYLHGIGFTAGQRYITSACGWLKVSKKFKPQALSFGPVLPNGAAYASVVNAAANYWKHSDEWDFDRLSDQQRCTRKIIESVGVSISGPEEFVTGSVFYKTGLKKFSGLIPLLEDWSRVLLQEMVLTRPEADN